MDSFSVSVMGTGVGYSAKNSNINYQLTLEQLLQKMQKQGKRLLVSINEKCKMKGIK